MLAETVKTERMPRGYGGTSRTIDLMHKLVQQAKLDPTMHRIATWIRASVPGDQRGSTKKMADAIFAWVKRHGLFQRDQFQVERIEHPISSMQSLIKARQAGIDTNGKLFAGDCDQFAIWVSTLGGILGFQYAFETSKSDAGRPDEFSHVWSALLVGPNWIAYDASTPQSFPNWRPPISDPSKLKRWPEKEIEGTLGMGDTMPAPFMVPTQYFGANDPINDGPPEVMENDPGQLVMMVTPEPAIPEAEMHRDTPIVDKYPVPLPQDRMSLIENDDTGPRYVEKPLGSRYGIERRPYPERSLWNRQRVSRADRAPAGPPAYYKNQRSTVPSSEVTVIGTTPITVVREGDRDRVVRRDLKSQVIVRRPAMRPAGVGAISIPSDAVIAGSAAASAGATAVESSKSVWDTISDVVKAVAPTASAAVLAKYAPTVASATNRVAGASVVTPQTYTGKPFYTQGWFLAAMGLIAVGGAAVVMLKPAKRRRR